jgi:uncharacterized membrane protein YbhN (UPF0104 family)
MILRWLLGLGFSLGLLWLLFRSTNITVLLDSLARVDYLLLVPAVLIYFLGTWFRSLRWRLMLSPVALVDLRKLFRATIIGFTVNDLMPVRVGEIARALLLARSAHVPPAATLGTIVVERLFDGLTLCAILGLGWLARPFGGWLGGVALLAAFGFGAAGVCACLAASFPAQCLSLARLAGRPLPASLADRVLALLGSFLHGLAALRGGRLLPGLIALSALAWLSEAGTYWFVLRGFGLELGPLAPLLGMVAANLGTMFPSLPGFVGTFHLPLKAVLTEVFQVDDSLAASYTLVVHAALILPVVVVGLILLWREGLSLAEVSRRSSGLSHRPARPPEMSGALAPVEVAAGDLASTDATKPVL